MIQDARKLEFSAKFDAVWLGPYLVNEVFLNNLFQLETLNGEFFPTRTSGSRCKHTGLEIGICLRSKRNRDQSPDGRQLCEPKMVPTYDVNPLKPLGLDFVVL